MRSQDIDYACPLEHCWRAANWSIDDSMLVFCVVVGIVAFFFI